MLDDEESELPTYIEGIGFDGRRGEVKGSECVCLNSLIARSSASTVL